MKNGDTASPHPLSIFVSHGSKYADIANSFKRSLEQVQSSRELSVKLSEDMPAGQEWRKWIDVNVRAADVFVLLYPHTSMDMGWCNYELGRFYQRDDNVVCIRNVGIPIPPPVFEPYQSIEADQGGLMKFMEDLFVTGLLTKGDVLNADVGKVTTDDGVLANKIARELAEQFAAARVDEQLYERRLIISVKYTSEGKFDAENSIIEGNENGINLLGFNQMPGMTWSVVRNAFAQPNEWPMELEQAMATMASGQSPPPLSPFRTPSGIFIPVIVRAEIVDRELRQVVVIFVPADSKRLGALIEGSSLPNTMPSNLKSLILLLRLLFRARWDILEPRRSEATYKDPSKERCIEIAHLVLSDYDELNRDLPKDLSGDDAFHSVFDCEFWPEIDACIKEWMALMGELRTKSLDNSEELSRLLTALRSNNAKWMNVGATQISKTIARYCEQG